MGAVNSEAIGGVHSYLLYGKETTFGTAVATNLHLGLLTSFRSSIANNLEEHRGFRGTTTGGREIVKYTSGKLDLKFNVDMKVTNWKFLEFVMGTVAGSSNPYTYTLAAIPPSLTVASNIDNPGPTTPADLEETFSGSVVNSCSIKSSVGQPVTSSLEFLSALCVVDTTLSAAVALPDEGVYNFTGGSIELPSGTALTNVTISNNFELLYGVGSRLARKGLPKQVDYKIKITLKYLDNALVTAALGATTPVAAGGPTEYATLKLTFADASRNAVFTFSKVPMTDFARAIEINTPIGEDISLTAATLSVAETR